MRIWLDQREIANRFQSNLTNFGRPIAQERKMNMAFKKIALDSSPFTSKGYHKKSPATPCRTDNATFPLRRVLVEKGEALSAPHLSKVATFAIAAEKSVSLCLHPEDN